VGPFRGSGSFPLCRSLYGTYSSKRCLKSSFPHCILCQSLSGTGTARSSFGPPTPRGRLKFGRMLACRTRTARNRRVKDVRRSVAGPLSAAPARYLPIGDSDFGGSPRAPYERRRGRACSHLHLLPSSWPPRCHPIRAAGACRTRVPERQPSWRAFHNRASRSWLPATFRSQAER